MQDLKVQSLDLEITTKCNLACPYCYIGIAKLKQENNFGDMSDETMEMALDLIEKYGYPRPFKDERGGDHGATHVDFYGGEPLLVFDRIKHFVERSRERGMRLTFTALSNGTVGNRKMVEWFKSNNIHVQRSIDGCPEVQEKYRPNSVKAYEAQNEIWADFDQSRRMTIQPEFAGRLMESLLYFERMGFKRGISPMPNFYTDWSDEQIESFCKSIRELGDYYVKRWLEGRPFYCYYFSNEIVGRFLDPGRTQFGCGGGRGLHCLSWDGKVYMCHRFSKEVEDGPFCFGRVEAVLAGTAKGYGEGVRCRCKAYDLAGRGNWNEQCKGCVAQHGCEKGCMHTNWFTTGTLDGPPKLYCRIRQEAALVVTMIDSKLRCKDPDWWARPDTVKGGSGVHKYIQKKQEVPYLTARLGEAVIRVDELKNKIMNMSRKKCCGSGER